jgi:hypothetical protein
MSLVRTVAPISIDNLKQYFTDKSVSYQIDYVNSTLKDSKLLTYLSNLDIPADIDFSECSILEQMNLLKEYLHSNMLVNINSLERESIILMLEFKGMSSSEKYKQFIQDNKEIIRKWISRIDSLILYNIYIVDSQEIKDSVKEYPEDDTDSTEGINFVSLLKHEFFYTIYGKLDQSSLRYYSKYFNDYMFKGKNLYSYWANDCNPMYILTASISEGILEIEDYVEAKKNSIKELEELVNATLV